MKFFVDVASDAILAPVVREISNIRVCVKNANNAI